jgi:hypothetical protein
MAPLYLISAINGSAQLYASAALTPREKPPVPSVQEAWWTPHSVWTLWRGEKCLPLLGIKPRLLCRQAHSLVTIPTELARYA